MRNATIFKPHFGPGMKTTSHSVFTGTQLLDHTRPVTMIDHARAVLRRNHGRSLDHDRSDQPI